MDKGGESAFLAGLKKVKKLARAADCTVRHNGDHAEVLQV